MQETNDSLGTYIKKMREDRNVSIEQVAYATRISLKMLRALEEDDHTALPAPTFVRGYLQAYAKYVRMDTQDLLLRYQHHLATAPDPKKNTIRSHYLYVRERYQEKRRLVLVIVLFFTMLSVSAAYFFLKHKRERNKRLAQTAEQIEKASARPVLPVAAPTAAPSPSLSQPTPAAPAPGTPAPAATKPAATTTEPKPDATTVASAPVVVAPPKDEKKTYNLLLKAEEDVWLRFQTDADEVRDLTLREGKAMMLRADKVIKIFSGNLGALKGTMNGQDAGSLITADKAKSVVLPASESANHPLPLFPQFQTKPATDAERAEGTGTTKNQ